MFLLFLCWCCNLLMQGLRDAARVKWEKDGISNVYRVGYKGKVSLIFTLVVALVLYVATLPNISTHIYYLKAVAAVILTPVIETEGNLESSL